MTQGTAVVVAGTLLVDFSWWGGGEAGAVSRRSLEILSAFLGKGLHHSLLLTCTLTAPPRGFPPSPAELWVNLCFCLAVVSGFSQTFFWGKVERFTSPCALSGFIAPCLEQPCWQLTKLWQVRKAVVIHWCLLNVCPSKCGGRAAIPRHVWPPPSSPALSRLSPPQLHKSCSLCCSSEGWQDGVSPPNPSSSGVSA